MPNVRSTGFSRKSKPSGTTGTKPKPFKPNAGQLEVLSILAHCTLAASFDQNIDGMKGYMETYLSSLEPRQQGIWQAFKDQCVHVKKEFVRLAKEDQARATP